MENKELQELKLKLGSLSETELLELGYVSNKDLIEQVGKMYTTVTSWCNDVLKSAQDSQNATVLLFAKSQLLILKDKIIQGFK
jgi:hypothetical protein